MRGRPMQGRTFGIVKDGYLMASVSGYLARAIWFDTEEDFLLRAPVTEEGYILPGNYVKVYENYSSWLMLDLENGKDNLFRLRSTDVLGWMKDQPPLWGTWRIYRGGPRGLWITFEEKQEAKL